MKTLLIACWATILAGLSSCCKEGYGFFVKPNLPLEVTPTGVPDIEKYFNIDKLTPVHETIYICATDGVHLYWGGKGVSTAILKPLNISLTADQVVDGYNFGHYFFYPRESMTVELVGEHTCADKPTKIRIEVIGASSRSNGMTFKGRWQPEPDGSCKKITAIIPSENISDSIYVKEVKAHFQPSDMVVVNYGLSETCLNTTFLTGAKKDSPFSFPLLHPGEAFVFPESSNHPTLTGAWNFSLTQGGCIVQCRENVFPIEFILECHPPTNPHSYSSK